MEENKNNNEVSDRYHEGDRVVVKAPNARCDTGWRVGQVTKANSPWNIEVDGVPRHLQDVRLARSISGGQEAKWRAPPLVIMIEDIQGDQEGQDERPSSTNDKLLTIPSKSCQETVSDENSWRSLPFPDKERPIEEDEETEEASAHSTDVEGKSCCRRKRSGLEKEQPCA